MCPYTFLRIIPNVTDKWKRRRLVRAHRHGQATIHISKAQIASDSLPRALSAVDERDLTLTLFQGYGETRILADLRYQYQHVRAEDKANEERVSQRDPFMLRGEMSHGAPHATTDMKWPCGRASLNILGNEGTQLSSCPSRSWIFVQLFVYMYGETELNIEFTSFGVTDLRGTGEGGVQLELRVVLATDCREWTWRYSVTQHEGLRKVSRYLEVFCTNKSYRVAPAAEHVVLEEPLGQDLQNAPSHRVDKAVENAGEQYTNITYSRFHDFLSDATTQCSVLGARCSKLKLWLLFNSLPTTGDVAYNPFSKQILEDDVIDWRSASILGYTVSSECKSAKGRSPTLEFIRQSSPQENALVSALVRDPSSAPELAALSHLRTNVRVLQANITDHVALKVQVDVIGTIHTINAFLPLMSRGTTRRIIAITTGLADTNMTLLSGFASTGPYALSALSKAALNLVIAKYAAKHKDEGILFACISPGFGKTAQKFPTPEELARFGEMDTHFKRAVPDWNGLPL
ncbi:hypothetical protein CERSUDRAFT_126259 [Gelatoporia subvermispora B]|uniref:Uncharacterized protein n=1 Tax=Ceriporiopsis subvermispora (strain B) TaxID=914234 RepID=M2QLP9_CERS8|nr:hypothetical protein CERSUDRAFT_126259 [Gelatoporia subvermispora B]